MRVLQIIDTLRPGGAERMAVNIANLLSSEVEKSFLCSTRAEGMLKEKLDEKVEYLFLNKKNSIDVRAFLRLRSFIIRNRVDLIHAHSTSWFFSILIKLNFPKLKLVWHDHYGESESVLERKESLLKMFSRYFDGVITVNSVLKHWVQDNLHVKKIRQINNFVVAEEVNVSASDFRLKGNKNDFKILCIANLRPQKDHFSLLEAFECLSSEAGISLHLIGGDPKTDYSRKLLEIINASSKKESVFYYGSIYKVADAIAQADLGVLASRSEGLPLVLLEYGIQGLPVVCTDVGQNKEVIGNCGKLVPPGNSALLALAMENYISKPDLREKNGEKFRYRVIKNYSSKSVLPKIMEFYRVI